MGKRGWGSSVGRFAKFVSFTPQNPFEESTQVNDTESTYMKMGT